MSIYIYIYILFSSSTHFSIYIYMYIHNMHLSFSSPPDYYNKLMLASFTAIQFILLCLLPPIFCIYHFLTSTTFTSFSNSRQMPPSFTANYFISFLQYTEITAIIIYCHFIYLIYLFIYPFTAIDFYWHHLLPVKWLFPPFFCQSIDCFLHFTASQLTVSSILLPVNWLFPPFYCQSIDCFLHFTASQLTVSSILLPVNWLFPPFYCQSIDCFLHFTASQLTVSFILLPNTVICPFWLHLPDFAGPQRSHHSCNGSFAPFLWNASDCDAKPSTAVHRIGWQWAVLCPFTVFYSHPWLNWGNKLAIVQLKESLNCTSALTSGKFNTFYPYCERAIHLNLLNNKIVYLCSYLFCIAMYILR